MTQEMQQQSSSLSDYTNRILKRSQKRKITITNSYGTKDAFKDCRNDNSYSGTSNILLFRKIVRQVNQEICNQIIKGNTIMLPNRCGSLYLQKQIQQPYMKKGKVIIPLGVDWQKTLELWHKDPQAEKDKILIRYQSRKAFKVIYDIKKAYYANKSYVKFHTNRSFKIAIKNSVNNGLDAYLKNGTAIYKY